MEQEYLSPSTPKYKHSAAGYLAEILMLKKYPECFDCPKFWINPKFAGEFIMMQNMAREIIGVIPFHYAVECVVSSKKIEFNSVALMIYIKKMVHDWTNKQNSKIKIWCRGSKQIKKTFKEVVLPKKENLCQVKRTKKKMPW